MTNILSARAFDARIRLANLVTKTEFDIQLKKNCDKVTSNKLKHLLVEFELKKTLKK